MNSYEQLKKLSFQNPIMFFDGDCVFCCKALQYFMRIDKNQILRYTTLQSEFGKEMMNKLDMKMGKNESVILFYKEVIYNKADVTLKVFSQLGFPYKAIFIFKVVPRFIRNWFYDLIAKNRYKWFGKTDTCYVPDNSNTHLFLIDRNE